jgi:hypothetical protein
LNKTFTMNSTPSYIIFSLIEIWLISIQD